MNAEVKEKWLVALRSGEYTQGIGRLKSHDGKCNCALGVLCDISGFAEWEWIPRYGEYRYLGSLGGLPFAVADWADVPPGWFRLMYQEQFYSIVYLNDTFKLSFDEIADLIEEQA